MQAKQFRAGSSYDGYSNGVGKGLQVEKSGESSQYVPRKTIGVVVNAEKSAV